MPWIYLNNISEILQIALTLTWNSIIYFLSYSLISLKFSAEFFVTGNMIILKHRNHAENGLITVVSLRHNVNPRTASWQTPKCETKSTLLKLKDYSNRNTMKSQGWDMTHSGSLTNVPSLIRSSIPQILFQQFTYYIHIPPKNSNVQNIILKALINTKFWNLTNLKQVYLDLVLKSEKFKPLSEMVNFGQLKH